ncbi:MAG: hypothetical protein JW918_17275 [Anaerolineae bacterium]|nr:hypothetical protein [Anaerolineae bacterium]
MELSLFVVAAIVIGIVVLLAIALGIVVIAISGREDRKTVIIIVAVGLLTLLCCLAAGAGAIGLYFYSMPR